VRAASSQQRGQHGRLAGPNPAPHRLRARSCQTPDFPEKRSALSHKQEKGIAQIPFFNPQEKNTFYLSLTKKILLKQRYV